MLLMEKAVHFNPEVSIHKIDNFSSIDEQQNGSSQKSITESLNAMLNLDTSNFIDKPFNIQDVLLDSEVPLQNDVLQYDQPSHFKEKAELLSYITQQKIEIRELQKQENEAREGIKKNIALMEEMKFEKSQADLTCEHLKNEIKKLQSQIELLNIENEKNIAHQKSLYHEEWNQKVLTLQSKLDSSVKDQAKLRLQLDQTSYQKSSFINEVELMKSRNHELQMEIKEMTINSKAQIVKATLEKDDAVNEVTQLRKKAGKLKQDHLLEIEILQTENETLQQRLHEMEHEYVKAKEECILFAQNISRRQNTTEPSTYYNQYPGQFIMKETISKNTNHFQQREKHLQKIIQELNKKYVETVHELDDIIESQRSLIQKILRECHFLTCKLKELDLKIS